MGDMTEQGEIHGAVFSARDERRLRRWAAVLAGGLFLAAAIGFLVVFRFAEASRARDLEVWRDRLTLVAEARAAAADEWLAAQREVVRGIAGNTTVRFFFTEFSWTGKLEEITDGEARVEIMRHLLTFTASQSGFAAPPAGADIPANIERPGRAGLAVAMLDGRAVVSTAWMPKIGPLLDQYRVLRPKADAVEIIGPYRGETGEATLAVVAPIAPVEGADGGAPVGLAIGVRLLGDGLYTRLRQPGDDADGGESYLVRRRDAAIDVLSPLADGAAPLAHALPDEPEEAAGFAASHPGAFAVKRNYDGKQVLVVGAPMTEAAWTVVRTVNAKAALGEITARRNAMLLILSLIIALLAAAGLMLWRHGASIRAAAAAAQASDLAGRFRALSDFLQGVMDAQPTQILAIDAEGRCRFGNRQAATEAGQTAMDLEGKSLAAIFGREFGEILTAGSRRALAEGTLISSAHRIGGNGKVRDFIVSHVAVTLPRHGEAAPEQGTLLVIEDVTALVGERDRREATLRQLVATIVTLVDSRDPFAAQHSRWVAELARAIAEEMGLSAAEIETAEAAGALLNLGKLLVRRDILTKSEALEPAEIDEVRSSLLKSAELLRGIPFDGPVVETLEQAQAHWDGSGMPAGLKGDAILPTARALAVANAFIAMISARAYRAPLPIEMAIQLLLSQAGAIYDRRPVAALIHYLDSRGGREIWEQRSRDSVRLAVPPGEG